MSREPTMADPYAVIAEADEAVQARLADVLDLRASDPQQRAMLHDYLSAIELSSPARALDIGCGTGSVTRQLLDVPGLTEVVGIDPSPVFIGRARNEGAEGLSFVTGDGRQLPFEDGSFDFVVCHTVLCHVPAPERVLSEAARVARDEAWLAVFDGDYPTATVANSPNDPLQSCIDATVDSFVHDAFLTRRLVRLVEAAGWSVARTKSHGYVETAEAEYMLTLVDRGADVLAASGRLGETAAETLKAEARDRVERGEFFGHIAYLSVIARLA
jgi:ubiquinone/menaquinone biosynthesis C-methylase UbiE